MPTSALILSAVILAAVLVSDLGRRAVTHSRLRRPLLIAGIAGSMYLSAFATNGDGLAIELAGAGVGAVLGLLAGSLMRVEHDHDGQAFTRAGASYALIWIAVIGTRLVFIYGSEHLFSASLGGWMSAHHVTTAALTDSLVLMALAMAVARTLSLISRARLGRNGGLVNATLAQPKM
ncbi:MAG: hypothetical protein ACRDJX_10605 [Solirubrobacteraceae bacterium]